MRRRQQKKSWQCKERNSIISRTKEKESMGKRMKRLWLSEPAFFSRTDHERPVT